MSWEWSFSRAQTFESGGGEPSLSTWLAPGIMRAFAFFGESAKRVAHGLTGGTCPRRSCQMTSATVSRKSLRASHCST